MSGKFKVGDTVLAARNFLTSPVDKNTRGLVISTTWSTSTVRFTLRNGEQVVLEGLNDNELA